MALFWTKFRKFLEEQLNLTKSINIGIKTYKNHYIKTHTKEKWHKTISGVIF